MGLTVTETIVVMRDGRPVAIVDLVHGVATPAGIGDIDGVIDGCYTLQATVDDALSRDPIPIDEVNEPYQSALRNFASAAETCIDLELEATIGYIDAGAFDLETAVTALTSYL